VAVDWRARIEEHLGAFKCELIQSHAALYLDDRLRLAGLSSACAVLEMGLPEREPYSEVYESLLDFIKNLETEEWLKNYVCWENNLLTALGFGLNLTSCAASGQTNDLIYVSPKSGRAVSKNAGEAYKDRLLSLPGFLTTKVNLNTKTDYTEVYKGLFLTGYFLDRNVFIHNRTGSPPARGRLVDQVRQNHIIDKTF
jgi:DNA repair protein RecO (recombination protein O)